MTDQWFYRVFGEDFGPVPFQQLREMADQGMVAANDEVRSANSPCWMTAGSVDGLGLSVHGGGTAVATTGRSDTATDLSTTRVGLDDWYCMLHGHEMGPLRFEELVKFAEHGNLSADDEVKFGTNGKWRRVGSIGRLVAVLPYQSVESKTPRAATKSNPATKSKTPDKAAGVTPSAAAVVPKRASTESMAETAIRTEPPKRAVASEFEPAAVETKPVIAPAESRRTPVSSPMSSSTSRSYSTSRPAAAPMRSAPKPVPSRRSSSSSSSLSDSLEFLKDPKALGAVGVLALLLLFIDWGYLPKNSAADLKHFHELKHIYDEIKVKRSTKSNDFAAVMTQAERVSKSVTAALRKKASRDNPVQLTLLWAARDQLPGLIGELKKAPAHPSKAEETFTARLWEAANQLGLKDTGLPAPPPAPAIAANEQKPGFPND